MKHLLEIILIAVSIAVIYMGAGVLRDINDGRVKTVVDQIMSANVANANQGGSE